MNIRRILLDVDKALEIPSVLELAGAISGVAGVEGANITVTDIDVETVGMDVTIEGDHLDFSKLEEAITKAGAAVHSIDELVVGVRTVERVPRRR